MTKIHPGIIYYVFMDIWNYELCIYGYLDTNS